jgi:hypothetical protein
VARFIEVFGFMSDNPTNLSVLFAGQVYRAGELPRRYMPFLLATTLTEPVWFLSFFGILAGYWKFFKQSRTLHQDFQRADTPDSWQSLRSSLDLAIERNKIVSLTLGLFWFVILVAYVLIRRPSMYDGLRHFLFIFPPVFIFTGFAFDFLIEHIARYWLYASLIFVLLLPGITGMLKLHPYEYTYYNSFIGGTSRAFRQYETDYWLTCYKEAMERLEQTTSSPTNVFVHREAYIAAYYAKPEFHVRDLRGALDQVQPGDYILVNTRTNEDRKVFKELAPILQVGRGDAIFCMVKQIP